MAFKEDKKPGIEVQSFPEIFVTGVTGAGKSRKIFRWLKSMRSCFMIISCSNNDYARMSTHGATIYGMDSEKDHTIRINPFYFGRRNVHIREHIERLMVLFTLCWSLDDEIRSIVEKAVNKSYEDYGWNIETSENKYDTAYPCFSSVLYYVEEGVKKGDCGDEKYKCTIELLLYRLRYLSNNETFSMTFSDETIITDQELFERDVIMDLSRFPSSEVKTLIMGTLVMRLYEYRKRIKDSGNESFSHVTVLEDAHVLLGQNITGNAGKNVILKELAGTGAIGEHFAVVERRPELLDESVIVNAESKFIYRLTDDRDTECIGKLANLSKEQIRILTGLKREEVIIS